MTDLDSARLRATTPDPQPVTTAATPSSKEIEQKQFVAARRGYDRHEVRAFLRAIADHLDRLEGQLERTTAAKAGLEEQLARAELDIRSLRADVAEERLRHREASSRLELCDALREDALARAKAAEAGRRQAEDLLVQVIQSYRPGDAEPKPADGRGAGTSRVPNEPRSGAGSAYLLTADQFRAIEEAAARPGEMTSAHAARILDAARGNADRINRAAHELAHLWAVLAGEPPDRSMDSVVAPSDAPARVPVERELSTNPEPIPGRSHHTSSHSATPAAGAAPPVRFTTNQARAAAMALHSSARDDLRLAEFWIQEAEQEASEDAIATSRIILEEAHQLLTMAAELGHPAPDLMAQYTEMDRRTRQPKD